MVQVIGAPELFSRVTANYGSMMIAREALIPQYIALVQALPMLPETDRNQYMPLDVFLHYEAEGYRRLIDTIMLDLNLLLHKARGEILPSPELNQVIYAINRNTVPASWSSEGFQTGMGLNGWFRELAVRLRYLRSYLLEERPATYCLSVFLRPDRFLEAVKQTYARKQFKDIDCIEFKVEVSTCSTFLVVLYIIILAFNCVVLFKAFSLLTIVWFFFKALSLLTSFWFLF
ncbi:hypothetical protein DPMN_059071 [Dreissena polymorpha]|uniref:Dynein heavy chain C-terminal domain-containing protein n=1 Tax=Dreissena polymorpha TaxID=45954 RepID=A0A9D4C365_DREPO|nr:hypothetical protein DPMN_059071 [Dreissena polymorpha]